ncbi:hypothetical protein [Streptomyces tauricus]|uniref:hypothetical protein n=1 Tax=Streptomyces tauricus TaxID=68274 RepID=UPI003445E922
MTEHDTSPQRPSTPDRINPDGSTTIRVKRACNGCGTLLGDLAALDVDEHGNLTDVRTECAHCRPLVALEAAGCKTWQVTVRSIGDVDDQLDRLGIFAKGYWEYVDGKTRVVGLRVGSGEERVVARFGDWLVLGLDGRFTVHSAPAAAVVSAEATR